MFDIGYLETVTITLITTLLVALLVKAYFTFSYFSKLNIPHYGLIQSLRAFSRCMPLGLWEIHKKCGSCKLFGFFLLWRPVILVKDVELIKQVLVKQFSNFTDRGLYVNEGREPLSGHLFALEGEKWRNLRQKLSPAFTSGRTKGIFPIATKYAEAAVNYILDHPEKESFECYNLMAKYTLSVIANFTFGIESDIFDDKSQFMKMSHKMTSPSYKTLVRAFLLFQLRDYAKFSPLTVIPRDVSSFFIQLTKDAVRSREESFAKDDFLQMLIQLKNKGSLDDEIKTDGNRLTMNQLAAQTFVFILGGFETSALAQSWALYELALNPDIQRRLQAEIDSVSDWTLETINGLEYLDMVLSETLRMYPSLSFLTRRCNKDTVLEGTDFVIKKGTDLNISLLGLHRDPSLFPNPDVFDPDRYGPNPTHQIQPYSYLPFGEGPRFCIGMRTGKIQFKMGIATILKHFNVQPTEKTTIPPIFHHRAVLLSSKHGVWLKFSQR